MFCMMKSLDYIQITKVAKKSQKSYLLVINHQFLVIIINIAGLVNKLLVFVMNHRLFCNECTNHQVFVIPTSPNFW